MKRWIYGLIPVCLLAGLIAWRFYQKQADTAMMGQRGSRGPASVEMVRPERRTLEVRYEVTGSVEAVWNVRLSPRVSGRIEAILAQEGDRVRHGQPLVRIDQSELLAQLQQQQANLAEAQHRLAQAQLNQDPTDVAVSGQVRQQSAALNSARADLTQAETARQAQREAVKALRDDAAARVAAAEAAVGNAEAAMRSAQASLDNATSRLRRAEELHRQGFIATQEVDDARTAQSMQQAALDAASGQRKNAAAQLSAAQAQQRSVEQQTRVTLAKADADVDAAQARVIQAETALRTARANTAQTQAFRQNLQALRAGVAAAAAQLQSARARLADTVLKSPVDGVVTNRHQDPGSLASPGQPVLTVQSINALWVTAPVPEDVCVRLAVGQPADLVLSARGEQRVKGRIIQIVPAADPESRQFTVRIGLPRTLSGISPGMFARVSLVTQRAVQALAIPRDAVQSDPSGGRFVFTLAKDNTAARTPVETGIEDANWVQIRSGLSEQTQVITMSASPLRDGQEVMVRKPGERGQRPGGRGAGRSRDARP